MRASRVRAAALAACALALAGATHGAPAAPGPARIVSPGPRDLVWGPTEVELDVPAGVEVVVERLVGPGRWQRLVPDADGRIAFDAGRDLGPETLRVRSWLAAPRGARRPLGEQVVVTALFPAPAVEVRPDPVVDVFARREDDPRTGAGAVLSADRMTCRYGGRPCRVRAVRRARRATLHLSLLVDASGSVCPHRALLADGLDELLDGLRDAPFDVRLRVVSFTGIRRVRRDPLVARAGPQDDWGLTGDVGVAARRIASIPCGGATALWDALYNELIDLELLREDLAARGEPTDVALLVFTDGQNTAGTLTLDDVHALLTGTRIPVFPLLLDPRIYGSDDAILSLGRQSGGRAWRVRGDATAVLSDLGRRLAERWEVVFRPDPRLLASRTPRRLELAQPGWELSWPRLWSPPRGRLARARRRLRRGDPPPAVLAGALRVVRREGTVRDGRLALEVFRRRLASFAAARDVALGREDTLERIEARLGLLDEPDYRRLRSETFYAVFATCARALAWRRADGRERRRALALLEDVRRFLHGRRYSIEHVMGPVLRLLLDPDFPADEALRARARALLVHNPA
ncbi:MAG: VWA domain-containing protein [Acidobacteria bacterium]|nr:MAG: VWA domain-containing protein [Acidobacteriota bacterium]